METLTLVFLPVFLGTIAISAISIFRRLILKSEQISPLQLLMHSHISIGLAFSLIYCAFWGVSAPNLLPGFWRVVLLGTTTNFFIQLLNVKAASIDKGEVSLTAPLQAMTPGLVTILALTLGEYPSKIGVAGIALIASGSYVLLFEKAPQHWWEYIGPIKRLVLLFKFSHLSPEEKNKTMVVVLSLGSAALGTFSLLFDGLYVRRGINFQGLTLAMITMMALTTMGYGIWYLIKPDSNSNKGKYSWGIEIYKEPKYLLGLAGIIIAWLVMIYTIQPTYNHTFVAYTGTLKRFAILISVIMGYVFFREGEIKKRLGAAILIVLGAALISIDDLPSRISAQMQLLGL